MRIRAFQFVAILLVTGCAATRPLKPGSAGMRLLVATNGATEFSSHLKQPENPAHSASQNYERITETDLPLSAGDSVTEKIASRDDRGQPFNRERSFVIREPTVQKTRVTERAGTVIGAAQKDLAREVGAKLSSLRGVVWLGAGLFIFGLATLVYGPLRAVVGSVTTSAAVMAGGVALMVLPSLVVGNELLILGAVAAFVAVWFVAHRHGRARGALETLTGRTR